MLNIIGLGLDDKEITQKGLEALEKSDRAYAEFYTNTKTIDLERIEEKTGTPIEELERSEVEQEDKIIEEAQKDQDVAFLVSGDALTATTHYDIKDRAKKKGIETKVVHAPSIFTSIGETGLSIYKFGRTVTLPRKGEPQSVVDHIEKNKSIELHTLILLDIGMEARQAAEKILEMKPEYQDEKTIVLEKSNNKDQKITKGKLKEVKESKESKTPACLIITGETTHNEEKFLNSIKEVNKIE